MIFHLRVNGRFTTQKVTGVQRYAIETSEALASLIVEEHAFSTNAVLVVPPRSHQQQKTRMCVRVAGCFGGHFWEQFSLPFLCDGFLLNFCNTYPIFKQKQIVVVHDASIYAMPKGYTRGFVLYYKFLFGILRYKKNVRVVTDSEFSRNEIIRYTGIPSRRISVVYCGADHWNRVLPDFNIVNRLGLVGRFFLLAVASANPNKNLDRLIQAYKLLSRPEIPLVLVGGNNSRVFSEESFGNSINIIRAGYLSDAELAALYTSAIGFVFPSLYEGFGLPPLEAMTFDCPVISSREASLPEVCGNAALYCNAYDPADIAAAMKKLIEEEDLRSSLILAGRIQVKKFKWRNTAQALINIVQEMA